MVAEELEAEESTLSDGKRVRGSGLVEEIMMLTDGITAEGVSLADEIAMEGAVPSFDEMIIEEATKSDGEVEGDVAS